MKKREKNLESKSSIIKVIQNAALKWVCKVKPRIINEVRSDNFWTSKISVNILMYRTIGIIKLKEYWDRSTTSYLKD